jgi:hypothetical protein
MEIACLSPAIHPEVLVASIPKDQKFAAELEAQVGRPLTEADWKCVDINDQTITVARNPLLAEIRAKEKHRRRGLDLDAEKRLGLDEAI